MKNNYKKKLLHRLKTDIYKIKDKHTVLDKFHQRYKGGIKMKRCRIRNAPFIKRIYLRKCHRVHYYVELYKTDVECVS